MPKKYGSGHWGCFDSVLVVGILVWSHLWWMPEWNIQGPTSFSNYIIFSESSISCNLKYCRTIYLSSDLNYNENKTVKLENSVNFVVITIVLLLFLATHSTKVQNFIWFKSHLYCDNTARSRSDRYSWFGLKTIFVKYREQLSPNSFHECFAWIPYSLYSVMEKKSRDKIWPLYRVTKWS